MGEIFAGLSFGPLLVLGSYYVQTGRYSWETLVASLAPGILTANLLFLNEFPDWEADQKGGRRHFVISLGKKDASYLFVAFLIASYLCILVGVLTKMMPVVTLIGLGTIGFGWKAAKGALKYYDNTEKLVPILGANVITILGTQALLAVGYVIATACFIRILRRFVMKIELTRQKVHNEFAKKVELISGQNLFACYQCGNCTAGCPVAFAMEVGPHEVIRYTLLGLEEEALGSQYLLALCFLPSMYIEVPQRN